MTKNTLFPNRVCARRLPGFAWCAVAAVTGPALPLQAQEWRLADVPVLEVGRQDGIWLHDVRDASIMADGSLLIGDNGSLSVLRMSPNGERVDSLSGPGAGPGKFRRIWRVFSRADTILAYDDLQSLVTTWVPGRKEEVRSLPRPHGTATKLRDVVSSTEWILTTWADMPREGPTALRDVYRDILFFDVLTRKVTTLNRRHIKYDYFTVQNNGITTYGMDFLGSAHIAAVGSRWIFIPLDRAVIEVWAPRERGSPVLVPLPLKLGPYDNKDVWKNTRASWLENARGERETRIRNMFDDLERTAPSLAPPVRSVVRMGEEVWAEAFLAGSRKGEANWIVADPFAGTVRGKVMIPSEMELLGGTGKLAVVLVRTDLGEEIVQVRKIVQR